MKNFIVLAFALLLTTVAVSAQMDANFAQSQRQNAQELRRYTWKSRTEIRKDGETKSVQLNLMRYQHSHEIGGFNREFAYDTLSRSPQTGLELR